MDKNKDKRNFLDEEKEIEKLLKAIYNYHIMNIVTKIFIIQKKK